MAPTAPLRPLLLLATAVLLLSACVSAQSSDEPLPPVPPTDPTDPAESVAPEPRYPRNFLEAVALGCPADAIAQVDNATIEGFKRRYCCDLLKIHKRFCGDKVLEARGPGEMQCHARLSSGYYLSCCTTVDAEGAMASNGRFCSTASQDGVGAVGSTVLAAAALLATATTATLL